MTGKDEVVVSNSYRYLKGLGSLDLYRNPPSALFTIEQVKQEVDGFQQAYEGGKTGNLAQKALRKTLRKKLTEMFKKIAFYLRSIATEEDIPALIQAGLTIRRVGAYKKVTVAPAT